MPVRPAHWPHGTGRSPQHSPLGLPVGPAPAPFALGWGPAHLLAPSVPRCRMDTSREVARVCNLWFSPPAASPRTRTGSRAHAARCLLPGRHWLGA